MLSPICLGALKFVGISWATILTIAFCGIDFAGIARLFTPQNSLKRGSPIQNDTWYLFGAWLLAATMNAILTWWGVSLAIAGRETFGAQVIERATLLRVVPIFVSLTRLVDPRSDYWDILCRWRITSESQSSQLSHDNP